MAMNRRTILLSGGSLGVVAAIGGWPSRVGAAAGGPAPDAVADPARAMIYTPTPEGIAIRNGRRFGNRPLYGFHRPSVVLAGDRPIVRLLTRPVPLGTFAAALVRDGRGLWLHDFDTIDATYLAGRQRWVLRDARMPGLGVTMEAMPLATDRSGFVARIACEGAAAGDRIILFHGGLLDHTHNDVFWQADPGLHPSVQKTQDNHQGVAHVRHLNELDEAFFPGVCAGNRVTVDTAGFAIVRADGQAKVCGTATGARFHACDAGAWGDPARLAGTPAAALPAVAAEVDAVTPVFFSAEQARAPVAPAPSDGADPVGFARPQARDAGLPPLTATELPAAFAAAQARQTMLATRIRCRTPDAHLDASVACAATVLDAIFYDPTMVHGAMAWNVPLIGWRSFYGSTAFGWHDRIARVADHYLPTQKLDGGDTCVLSAKQMLTLPVDPRSRFEGRGRMPVDGGMYDMQAVFFDQLIHAWEATGDADFEKALLPALQRHLDWEREVFDTDGDGLYEAYLNTWASDSMWYYGSGVSHATAYVIRGHEAAARMAARQGDPAAAKRHRDHAAFCRAALERVLWLPERGHLAESVEPSPYRRVHEDATLYAVNIPVDCGVVDRDRGIQIIDYADWGLERVPQPAGGALVYTSNCVPDVWSVRELDNADSLHTALAAFRVGMAEDGWSLLRGTCRQSLYASAIPGGLLCEPPGNTYSSTDFSDPTSMYARTVVEGVFGWRPDAPAGVARIAPNLPPEWDHTEFATPDFTFSFRRQDGRDVYRVTTARPWRIELTVPQRAVAAAPAGGLAEAGLGCPAIRFVAAGGTLDAVVRHDAAFAGMPASLGRVAAGAPVTLAAAGGRITGWHDPQGVLAGATLRDGRLAGRVQARAGRHLIFAEVTDGAARWRQLLRLDVQAPEPAALVAAPAGQWRTLSLDGQLDAALTAIYRQDYLSPRLPCSAQLGRDGWTAWTHSYWGVKPPVLGMGAQAAGGRVVAANGVPFTIGPEGRNIALTSTWSNYPTRRSLSVAGRGRQLALLLSGATNQMQAQIANARLTVRYADGKSERHDIEHPKHFWSVSGKYDYARDGFALPKVPPVTIDFDAATRATVMIVALRAGAALKAIELETLSPEVSVGIMAASLA